MGKALVFLAGLFVLACASPPGGVPEEGAGATNDDLAASLQADVGDDSVRLTFHVTNTSDETLEFRFPTSQRYDFVVENSAGERVWQWSEDMAFAQVITEARLGPGETWDFEASWPAGVGAGTYRATGWITTRDGAVRQSTTFELR